MQLSSLVNTTGYRSEMKSMVIDGARMEELRRLGASRLIPSIRCSWFPPALLAVFWIVSLQTRFLGSEAYHSASNQHSRCPENLCPWNTSPSRRAVLDILASATTAAVSFQLVPPFQRPAFAMTNDPKTGIALPDTGEIEMSIPQSWDGVENPFADGSSDERTLFGRLDSKDDSIFYADPRFVEHVDENAVHLMTEYISTQALSPNSMVLDLCSSWTSHVTPDTAQQMKQIVGLGMNSKELEANKALSKWDVQDLNIKPQLPYEDKTYDVVLCQLSIDYLTRPLEVMKEVGRVLKPGGKVHILFSNRLFLSKAVGLWTGADDLDHAYYVGCYLHFCQGGFDRIQAKDLSARRGRDKRIAGDPLYVVVAEKMG